MNGWSSHAGAGGWDDEPAWIYEITWEWEPLPGQRYPGDQGRRRAVHTPVYEASRAQDTEDERGVGRATVGPPPAQPAEWSDPAAAGAESLDRQRGRAARDQPAWNRPVPLPERLPEGRPSRPPGAPPYDQRTPFRDNQSNLQDALAGYYGPRAAAPEP